jgi:hypothetical protein
MPEPSLLLSEPHLDKSKASNNGIKGAAAFASIARKTSSSSRAVRISQSGFTLEIKAFQHQVSFPESADNVYVLTDE